MRVAFGRFTFDSETRELLEDGRRIHVSPKAFDVLQMLLECRPRVVSKTELQDRVWAGTFVVDANLSVVVAEIRQVLGDDSKEGRFVRTVHRVGYAFCGRVAEAPASPELTGLRAYSKCWLAWGEKTFPLVDGENVIGRDPRWAIWMDASGVSKRHARITVNRDQVTLEDLDSSNGTFVGGKRLTSCHRLVDGDVIELGSATMTFRMWSDERPPKTERLSRPTSHSKR
jgi:DNA-binding winged helix-turn-helix (wHTH) protein